MSGRQRATRRWQGLGELLDKELTARGITRPVVLMGDKHSRPDFPRPETAHPGSKNPTLYTYIAGKPW